MKVNCLLFLLFVISINNAEPSSDSTPEQQCTYGSHKKLYQFFTDKNYVVIAQGKHLQSNGRIKDFADVIFLVSQDMAYFHTVTLSGIKYNHFKACINYSAREVDYQFAAPTPGLLERKNREHIAFFTDNLPKNTPCPKQNSSCKTWSEWSLLLEEPYIFSAYRYANHSENDLYNEIVELTIDNQIIRPTRGKLSQHARIKYALRLRNELNESVKDNKSAKLTYLQIHNEVDHQLPLIFLLVNEKKEWSINQIDRTNGLAKTIIQGIELELYPMQHSEYKKLLPSKEQTN